MNLADEYVNLVPRFGLWKDNAIRLKGCSQSYGIFLQMWKHQKLQGQWTMNSLANKDISVQ